MPVQGPSPVCRAPPGIFNFAIGVSDGSIYTPSFSQSYSIAIESAITVSPSSIPAADALSPYSQFFTAAGGSGSGYTYTISPLPAGMSFNGSSGTLSGSPSTTGPNMFTITARDSAGFTGTSPTITPECESGAHSLSFDATPRTGRDQLLASVHRRRRSGSLHLHV